MGAVAGSAVTLLLLNELISPLAIAIFKSQTFALFTISNSEINEPGGVKSWVVDPVPKLIV